MIKRIINGLIKRGYWYNNIQFQDCRKFWIYNCFNTDVINLGSTSSLYAFNYEGLAIKGANFALSHNPLEGDLAILKNYLSYLKNGGVVLIPLCPFSSFAGNYSINEDRYYTLLYATTIPSYSYKREMKVDNIKKNPLSVYPLVWLFRDILGLLLQKKKKILSEDELEKDAKSWFDSWLNEFSVGEIKTPLPLYLQDAILDAKNTLKEILKCCLEHNFTPVVLIPPIYHTLSIHFTPTIRNILIEPLVDCAEDQCVLFKNYMDDPEFMNDRSLFSNSFFLNEKGAKLFTAKVLSDINVLQNDTDKG